MPQMRKHGAGNPRGLAGATWLDGMWGESGGKFKGTGRHGGVTGSREHLEGAWGGDGRRMHRGTSQCRRWCRLEK